MISIHLLESLLVGLGLHPKEIGLVKLQGDASTRSYFRISFKNGEARETRILMVLGQTEAFSEATSGTMPPGAPAELPFINVQRHLRACGIAVPEIYCYDAAQGWLLLEDLGDRTLSEALLGQDEARIASYYQKAVDILIRMQQKGTPYVEASIAHGRAFDQALLMWELNHFIEYGIEARQGVALPDTAMREIRASFSEIALRLSLLPQVFTHRDYHSRNLMVQAPDDRIRVLDFQDALMGPPQYDLASLLRDSYVELPETLVDRLIAYYLQGCTAHPNLVADLVADPVAYPVASPAMFRELFDLMSLQRNMKAAGRFVYIDRVKGNHRFLQYVPPTLAKIRRNLRQYPRWASLHRLLSEFVPELSS